jgi:putative copper export protein
MRLLPHGSFFMFYIIERFIFHFAWAIVLVGMVYYGLDYWLGRNVKVGRWLSERTEHLLVVAALIVVAVMPLREAYDVAFGNQPWYKTPFDQLSWFAGSVVGVWGFYRLEK